MKIISENPPNIKKIVEALGVRKPTVIYTYGPVIYNPGNGYIGNELMAHEETHMVQQGNDPDSWWDKYLKDPDFRLKQELEAYRNQIKEFRSIPSNRSREKVFFYIRNIALSLSGPTYGGIINYEKAFQLLKYEQEKSK